VARTVHAGSAGERSAAAAASGAHVAVPLTRVRRQGPGFSRDRDTRADPAEREARSAGDAAAGGTRVAVRSAAAAQDGAPPSSLRRLVPGGGTLLEPSVRAPLEARLGHDFSHVRVHADAGAARAAAALDARAFTIGRDIVLGAGHYAPGTEAGRRLLAHELTHVAQQADGPVRLQRDAEDPARFTRVHERLFERTPSGGTPRPWRAASGADRGSAGEIIDEFKDALRRLIAARPGSVEGHVATRTTSSNVESDAIAVDQRLRTAYPQIASPKSEASLRAAVGVISSAQTSDPQFVRQWLANRLSLWTSVDELDIDEADPRYQAMLTDLLADGFAGPHILTLTSRQAGLTEGEAGGRRVFIHRGAEPAQRRAILVHELTHLYVSPGFKDWVAETNGARFYEEGVTEYLARPVMTDEEKVGGRSYQANWQAVHDDIATFVSPEDIARAYFLGEVWRLESRSEVSRRLFAEQVGLKAGASRQQEASASRTGPGINETVVEGAHYRFLNLGHDRSQPKPEHVARFGAIERQHLAGRPAVRARFVGHASSPGPLEHNLRLSLRRALAFYQMARDAGVPDAQLADAAAPAHFGESSPTAGTADIHARAFNRRVELFLAPAPAAGTRAAEPEGEPAREDEP
jgi:outer membrane protein OmpA-like peptidoglycan-associated protein